MAGFSLFSASVKTKETASSLLQTPKKGKSKSRGTSKAKDSPKVKKTPEKCKAPSQPKTPRTPVSESSAGAPPKRKRTPLAERAQRTKSKAATPDSSEDEYEYSENEESEEAGKKVLGVSGLRVSSSSSAPTTAASQPMPPSTTGLGSESGSDYEYYSSSEDEAEAEAKKETGKAGDNSSNSSSEYEYYSSDDESEESSESEDEEELVPFPVIGIEKSITLNLNSLGMNYATPIQKKCVPAILSGKHPLVVGQARTGSGKTAAFALPIIQKLSEDPFGMYCLVLTPSRELAIQLGEQFTLLGRPVNTRVEVVIGGQNETNQALALSRRPHIVVATPGRLIALLKSAHGINFMRSRYLVLDEADRLLLDGMSDQVSTILEYVNPKAQKLLFTATMSQEVRNVARMVKDSYIWEQTKNKQTADNLTEEFVLCPAKMKELYLWHICESVVPQIVEKGGKVMIFGSTTYSVQLWHHMLRELHIDSLELHGNLTQEQRLSSLSQFRQGRCPVLIASDVAARGLDIPKVALVVNADLPQVVSDYVHRVGRAARAGRSGRAISIVTQFDVATVHAVEKETGSRMGELETEKMEELAVHLNKVSKAAVMARTRLDSMGIRRKKRMTPAEFKEFKKRKAQQSRSQAAATVRASRQMAGRRS